MNTGSESGGNPPTPPAFSEGTTSVAGAAQPTRLLYRSSNLAVRTVPADDATCWIVTFDHFNVARDLDRPGFSEAFLQAQGWSAIHVLGSGNDWYQYDDLPAAFTAIRFHLRNATRVVTYGSSMGGYAALHFAGELGADAVLALSPQYSVNPKVVPWEKRWLDDACRIRWRPRCYKPLPQQAVAIVMFDPADTDRHHAARLATETGCTLVPLPYAGHPVTTFLGELHLLRPLLSAVHAGNFTPAVFQQSVRHARRTSSVFLSHLALKQPAYRPRVALRLAETALETAPRSGLAMHILANIHRRMGRDADAIALLEKAVKATARRDLNHLYALAEALLAAGQPDAAMRCMAEAIELAPELAHLRAWQARALSRNGKIKEAIAMQASALALAPARRAYRSRLWKYRVNLLVSWARATAPRSEDRNGS